MRPLEALLIISLGVSAISLFIEASRRNRWLHLLPAFSLAIAGIHLIVEGYRWQMVPAYLLACLLFLFTLRNIRYGIRPWMSWQSTDHRVLRIIGALVSSLLMLDILFLQWFVPLFKLPQPTGPYHQPGRAVYRTARRLPCRICRSVVPGKPGRDEQGKVLHGRRRGCQPGLRSFPGTAFIRVQSPVQGKDKFLPGC